MSLVEFGGRDDGGIDNRSGLECHAAALEYASDFGEELLIEGVLLQQATKFEQRRGIRYGFASQLNSGKMAQAGDVVEASSQAKSARLNQCWIKWMRSIRSSPIGGQPVPRFG
jgi:hypothetical protein